MKIELILALALISVFVIDYLIKKKKSKSTSEIEKVVNYNFVKNKKLQLIIACGAIVSVIIFIITDKQFYGKTLLKNDGFSFVDKLVSKRYNINDVFVHTKNVDFNYLKTENYEYLKNIDGEERVVIVRESPIFKLKSDMNIIMNGIIYDSIGNLAFINNGLINGKYIFRDDDGTSTVSYNKGIINGIITSTDRNNILRERGIIEMGVPNGTYETFDTLGNKTYEANYKKGYLDGLRVDTAQEKIEPYARFISDSTYFKMGMRILKKGYFSNKKLKLLSSYKNDTLNGRFKLFINEGDDLEYDYFYEMGQVKEVFKSPTKRYRVGVKKYSIPKHRDKDFLEYYPSAIFIGYAHVALADYYLK